MISRRKMEMKKSHARILSLAICFAMIFTALAGCSGGSAQQSGTPQTSSSAAPEKAHPVLNLRTRTDVNILDPHETGSEYEYFISMQIFDSLVKFNGSDVLNVKPSLAESWEISDDGLVYTFKLRDDVSFHSGDKLTADDVVYSVQRFITEKFTKTKAPFVTGAEAVDEHTVKINLSYAYPNFILQLASWPWRIVSKAAVEKYGAGTVEMVMNAGTGPYKLKSVTPGVGVTLVANPDYFEGAPYFDEINYKLIPDDSTALTALLNGEIDLDLINSGLDAQMLREENGFSVTTVERAAAYILEMNTTAGVMANENFRKAVAYAIDKPSFVDLVYDGEADPNCISLIRSYEEGYSDDLPGYSFDLEKAREYLEKSGIPQSEWKFTLEIPATGKGPAYGATMKEMMAKVGITVELVQVEYGSYMDDMSTSSYDTNAIMLNNVSIPYNPPLLYNLYFKSTAYLNLFGANRPGATPIKEIDELGAAASKELDDAKRDSLFNQMYRVIQEKCLYIPIAYIRSNFGHSSHLKGMEWEPGTLCTKVCTWYWEE